MTSTSENMYTNKLDNIVNKYNNTYHSWDKLKPIDVKSSTYINSSKEINDEDPKFAMFQRRSFCDLIIVISVQICTVDILLMILKMKK